MPTGYTADVADGKVTDFPTFALRCVRQFGACVMQRDDPMDAPPQLREVSQYTIDAVARDKARTVYLASLTAKDAEREALAKFDTDMARHRKYEGERTVTRNRYTAMLSEVRAWEAPSSDHQPLRRFMIDQLTESIGFDCGPLWDAPTQLSGPEWLADETAKANKSLARSREYLAEEEERVRKSNAWITALYESLAAPVPS